MLTPVDTTTITDTEIALVGYYKTKMLKAFKLMRFKTWCCSTKGVGRTAPDLSEAHELDDGVVVPLGMPKEQQGQQVLITIWQILALRFN